LNAATPDDRFITGIDEGSGQPNFRILEYVRELVDRPRFDNIVIVDEKAEGRRR
jgi:hypothetical protein